MTVDPNTDEVRRGQADNATNRTEKGVHDQCVSSNTHCSDYQDKEGDDVVNVSLDVHRPIESGIHIHLCVPVCVCSGLTKRIRDTVKHLEMNHAWAKLPQRLAFQSLSQSVVKTIPLPHAPGKRVACAGN
ncbi:hypothetical protein EYF80_008580 [Liparis tanakae]|uniref:Uncharacterized protein n=1 Tax=Liparis tanakae TaxID=230148 RepID=A0A4Z2ITS3_9TELE|nr:hypothetical protein EYF80_008580 [Liparis tanakae]